MPDNEARARVPLAVGATVILRHYNLPPNHGYGGFHFKHHRIAGETRVSWLVGGGRGFKPVRVPKRTLEGTYDLEAIRALEAQFGRRYLPVRPLDRE